MVKENIADSILAKVNDRVMSISNRLSKQYKGVKPFDSQKAKPEDQLYWYEHLGIQDMDYLIEKYGWGAINEYVFNMETIKQRRSKNA
tara:strand:- start:1005 stop:1268 length:264 start_codon:yes stop_codon:yes gene_type:complete